MTEWSKRQEADGSWTLERDDSGRGPQEIAGIGSEQSTDDIAARLKRMAERGEFG